MTDPNPQSQSLSIQLKKWLETKKDSKQTDDDFMKSIGLDRSVMYNINRGRAPRLATLLSLLRAILEHKKASPSEILSVLLGIPSDEIETLEDFSDIDFSEIEIEADALKKKIENLAEDMNYNAQKIEMFLQSIPETIDSAIEKLLTDWQKGVNIGEIKDFWPQWEGKKVRLIDSPARYRSLDIAGGVNLVVEGRELDSRYEVEIALIPHGDYVKEGTRLSVELGNERQTIIAASQTDSLDDLNVFMSKGDILDIVIECENRIYRTRFQY